MVRTSARERDLFISQIIKSVPRGHPLTISVTLGALSLG